MDLHQFLSFIETILMQLNDIWMGKMLFYLCALMVASHRVTIATETHPLFASSAILTANCRHRDVRPLPRPKTKVRFALIDQN